MPARPDPADILSRLISCPSVTPAEAGALGVVEAELRALGFACQRLTFSSGPYPVENLYATRGKGGAHLLYCGHVDVVPPGDEADWTHPPFSGAIVDGEVWGRGAIDMKGSVAAFLAALHELGAEGALDAGRVSLIITCDEEAVSADGTVKVLAHVAERGEKFDFALVGEPTSKEKFGDMLKIGRRGSLAGMIEVTGQQGHSAYPHEAKNPLPVLARIAATLADAKLDEGNANFPPSHLALTSIDTGNKAANVIPARAKLNFNIRFNDRWNEMKLQGWLAQQIVLVPAEGCDVAIEIFQPVAQSFVSSDAPAVALLAQSVKAISGREPQRSTSGGTSDARFIAPYCPVAEFGGVGRLAHKTDERVAVAELIVLQAVYAHFVKAFLRTNGK